MAWTEEMVEELKKLWDEGVTTGEIGRRLHISKNSIVGKVHRLGLSGRPSPIKKKSDTETKDKATKTEKQPKEKKSTTKELKPEVKKDPVKQVVAEPVKNKPEEPKKITTPEPKPLPIEVSDEEDIKLAKTLNISNPKVNKTDNLSLVELDNHTCRWPIGDPKDENFHFCGKKIRLGQTYCEEHAAIAYVKPNKK
jgi:GcrA cell cycle regulator